MWVVYTRARKKEKKKSKISGSSSRDLDRCRSGSWGRILWWGKSEQGSPGKVDHCVRMKGGLVESSFLWGGLTLRLPHKKTLTSIEKPSR